MIVEHEHKCVIYKSGTLFVIKVEEHWSLLCTFTFAIGHIYWETAPPTFVYVEHVEQQLAALPHGRKDHAAQHIYTLQIYRESAQHMYIILHIKEHTHTQGHVAGILCSLIRVYSTSSSRVLIYTGVTSLGSFRACV